MPKYESGFQPSKIRRVAFYTFGCMLNQSETATIAQEFDNHGYEIVKFGEPADLYVINTCTVTHKADSRARTKIRQVNRAYSDAFVAVVGCYAEHKPEEIASIEGVDLILGAEEKFRLIDMLSNEARGEGVWEKKPVPEIMLACEAGSTRQMEAVPTLEMEGKTRIFMKIQDGCDYSCSFCIIPQVRGGGRVIPLPEILNRARQIIDNGYREIVLTGVNIGTYQDAEGHRFIDVVEQLADLSKDLRLRISSVEPNCMTVDLLQLIGERENICSHLHLPLQSGSDRILRKMRRRYLTDRYREVVSQAVKYVPNLGLGADVLVGFPDETDEDFATTIEFIESLPVSYLHVFTYSPRRGTDAAEMEHQVDPQTHQRRSFVLRQLSKRKHRQFLARQVGNTKPVLFEPGDGATYLEGWTSNYARIRVGFDPDLINDIVPVHIQRQQGEYLTGEVVARESATL